MFSRRCGAGAGAGARASLLPPLCALLALLPAASSNPVGALSGGATSKSELGCSVGDVVYLPGDAVPGREPCEQCACGAGGALACRRRTCDARPGCKALHRPDECCPTYQCECEQEGRVYANGEKLVDPVDPCKVCYCQGGEVVCRRIACFLRNDCEPRHVPGRCCPEYDHCPLRGVSTEAGKSTGITTSVGGSTGAIKSENIAQKPDENIKKEITIKEVTPVSEIPAVFSGIRIKEIPPSPIAEIIEYPPTSKTPVIPKDTSTQTIVAHRTLTSSVMRVEVTTHATALKTEPSVKEMESRISVPPPPSATEGNKLSHEGAVNYVETLPSVIPPTDITSRDRPASTSETASPDSPQKISEEVTTADYRGALAVTKPAPTPEEDDSSTFELVNPAFPPLPDDLSELNRDDSDVTELHEHPTSVNIPTSADPIPTSSRSDTHVTTTLPGKMLTPEIKVGDELPEESNYSSTERPLKSSPLLNLRSALPTNILNAPSALPEVITGDLDVTNENSAAGEDDDETTLHPEESTTISSVDDLATTNVSPSKLPKASLSEATPFSSSTGVPLDSIRGDRTTVLFAGGSSDTTAQTTSQEEEVRTELEEFDIKSNTEKNIPILTSIVVPEPTEADISSSVGIVSFVTAEVPISITNPPEVVQIAHASTTPKDIELFKATESPSSASDELSESVTGSPTLSSEEEHSRSGALIQPAVPNKNNVLTDLINLVGDVASIGEHTERPHAAPTAAPAASFPDSEELLPVRGHLTKVSSEAIGEVDSNAISESSAEHDSTAAPGSQELRTIEITDDDTGAVTDSPPPFDRVEPTTRRPIIDRVSDSQPSRGSGVGDGVATNKKDIEIITKSYVPTINRRPTKVVMKKNSEAASVAPVASAAGSTAQPDNTTLSPLTPQ